MKKISVPKLLTAWDEFSQRMLKKIWASREDEPEYAQREHKESVELAVQHVTEHPMPSRPKSFSPLYHDISAKTFNDISEKKGYSEQIKSARDKQQPSNNTADPSL